MNMDDILAAISAAKYRREMTLAEAFRDPDQLRRVVLDDCGNLIAGIGGYAAPVEFSDRQAWIINKMLTDAAFVAKCRAAASLIHEYIDHAACNSQQRRD